MLGRKRALWLAAAISVLTFMTVSSATGATRERPCNGSSDLCGRTLDQVTLPGTHDSMSNAEYGWGLANQSYSIPSQLELGVRAMLIDTHYGKSAPGVGVSGVIDWEGDPGADGVNTYLCHSTCILGASNLTAEFGKIADFLSKHPREVLVFVVQDDITPLDHAKAVEESGLIDYIYTGPTSAYPTLREMIATNQRVVMLSEGNTGTVPWFHDGYAGALQETPYNFREIDLETARRSTQEAVDLLTNPLTLNETCRPFRGGETGALFLMNHWVNGRLDEPAADWETGNNPPAGGTVPDPEVAQFLNQPDALVARAEACGQRRGKLPNIIAVDNFERGDTVDAARTLNGVQAKAFFEVTRPRNSTVTAGKKATFKFSITNFGDLESAVTRVCATVPARLASKPKCRTVFVPRGNPGKASTSITVVTKRKGKGSGAVKLTVSGARDSVSTSATLKVKPAKKKPKRSRR
ncbi:MAG: hypothetical protein KDB57_02610 [Solirubrobacterales bacterium]|nr:hypothetical protein [Solirubrobacterales bacterium]